MRFQETAAKSVNLAEPVRFESEASVCERSVRGQEYLCVC